MPTNLALDDKLIVAAQKAGGHVTKKAAVTEALQEYVQRHEQMKVAEIFGEIDYDPRHDYKKQRKRK